MKNKDLQKELCKKYKEKKLVMNIIFKIQK